MAGVGLKIGAAVIFGVVMVVGVAVGRIVLDVVGVTLVFGVIIGETIF